MDTDARNRKRGKSTIWGKEINSNNINCSKTILCVRTQSFVASLLSPPVALQGSNWTLSVSVRVVISTFRVIFTAVQKPHLAHILWQQLVSCPIRTKEINPTDASHTLINVSLSSFEKFRQRNKAVSQLSKPALRTFLWRPLSKMFIYSKPSLLAW